ncbi:MAG: MopE-related protein [Myxococcota bacterium]
MARVLVAALLVWTLSACGGGGSGGQGDADGLLSDGLGEVGAGDVAGDAIVLPDAAVDAEVDAAVDADAGAEIADGDAGSDGPDGSDAAPPDDGTPGDASQGGEFGAACEDGSTCFSGFCVEGPNGPQCTSLCQSPCPSGWACKGVGGAGDVTFICVYDHVSYCAPCETKADCDHPLTPGADNRCVAAPGGAGSFCATACVGGGCPDGANCEALPDGKTVCRPADGVCACSGYAVRVEATTECSVANGFGECFGARGCGAAGLSDCDAAAPAADLCGGLDEDCDGLTDEDFLAGGSAAAGGPGLGAPCDGADADDCDNGTWACSADGLSLVCAGEGATGGLEACNGLDDDCDGKTDEDFPGLGGKCDGDDSDQCAEGLLGCNAAGDGTTCGDLSGDSVEVCDGVDDDCDGATDEDFGVGDGCPGVGACGAGVLECASKAAARCSTNPGGSADESQPEICDGADDDCDGKTDESFGVGGACEGVGACGAGSVECDGTAASRCSTNPGGSEDGATSETCDGVDEDCDGKTDEDYLVGAVCDGVGKCGAGKLECAGLDAAICSTDLGGSQAQADVELCNAADDDCDGKTDEAFAVGDACEGEGECGAGVVECAGLQGSRCSSDVGGTAAEGAAEVCDGLDNDCDGLSDEGYGVGQACEGVGACGAGVFECAGLLAAGCSTDPGRSADEAGAETCNGVDDDCDGKTDEDFGVGGACDGVGACGIGKVECAGAAATRCSTDVGARRRGTWLSLQRAGRRLRRGDRRRVRVGGGVQRRRGVREGRGRVRDGGDDAVLDGAGRVAGGQRQGGLRRGGQRLQRADRRDVRGRADLRRGRAVRAWEGGVRRGGGDAVLDGCGGLGGAGGGGALQWARRRLRRRDGQRVRAGRGVRGRGRLRGRAGGVLWADGGGVFGGCGRVGEWCRQRDVQRGRRRLRRGDGRGV